MSALYLPWTTVRNSAGEQTWDGPLHGSWQAYTDRERAQGILDGFAREAGLVPNPNGEAGSWCSQCGARTKVWASLGILEVDPD